MSRVTGKKIVFTAAATAVVAAVVIGIVVEAESGPAKSTAPSKISVCQASQIDVSLGSSMKLSSEYPGVSEIVPMFFKNRGPECRFREGGPSVQAGIGSHKRPNSSLYDSFPAVMPRSYGSISINRGGEDEALFEVVRISNFRNGGNSGCTPKTATWLSISGYALPVGSGRFFSRKSFWVCFANPGVPQKLNTEIVWLGSSR